MLKSFVFNSRLFVVFAALSLSGAAHAEKLNAHENEVLEFMESAYSTYWLVEYICMGYYPQNEAEKFIADAINAAVTHYDIEDKKAEGFKDNAWDLSKNSWKQRYSSLMTELTLAKNLMGKSELKATCIQLVDQMEPKYRQLTAENFGGSANKSKRKF